MKKHYTLLIFLFAFWSQAQNGITYQAVILNPNSEELPGVDNSRLPLVNQKITLEFKILNATSNIDYQETINTETDEFGMVNVVIGTGTRKAGIASQFSAINWDGSAKNLIVSLDPSGQSTRFIEISNQPFTYVPFALYAANAGTTGSQGPAGPTGSNGLDGKTLLNGTTNPNGDLGTNGDFYINTATNNFFGPKTNGNWGSGVPLVGPQGIQGSTGLTGATGAQGPQGFQGPQGSIGLTGATGLQGVAGTNGLSAYQIWLNAGNTGTEAQFLTTLRGATGAQGSQGIQGVQGSIGLTGATGPQGLQGVAGTNGLSAYQIWLNAGNTGTESQFVTALRGATGAQGTQGIQGLQGLQGPIGITGATGPQGIQGVAGPTGAAGPQGTAGNNGSSGTNGLSAYQIWLNAGNTGTEAQFLTALRGATGAQGIQGATGTQGIAGTNGTNGLDGKTVLNGTQSPTNSTGNNGDFYINTTTNLLFGPKTSGAWGSGIALVGPQGAAGTNGKNSLINTTTVSVGSNDCPNGGIKIEIGLDLNNNGILETSEINNNNTKYICNVNNSNLTLQERLDLGENPFTLINSGIPINNFYGKNYHGGLIFYLDSTTSSGLVVTNYNVKGQGSYGCYNVDIATGSGIFDGLQNTINTVNNGCANYNHPATVCYNLIYNGYDDWYLPSSGEAMKIVNNIPGWNQYEFWTSTQTSPTQQVLIQGNGGGNGDKNTFSYPFTRAIRTFH